MIPKIIYFTWISPDPIPERFLPYIESWKRVMPDYEIRQISLENIKRGPFVDKCLETKKYVIAGHYALSQALYETGGIYVDIDVEAVKPLDELLDAEIFLGREDEKMINNAVIGSVAGNQFMKDCMDFMDSFDLNAENPELNTGPWMLTDLIDEKRPFVTIYPPRFFYPYSYKERFYPECVTSDTYLIHHWAKTWIK